MKSEQFDWQMAEVGRVNHFTDAIAARPRSEGMDTGQSGLAASKRRGLFSGREVRVTRDFTGRGRAPP